MKKLYFSAFVEGLEKPIEAMLHKKEGGVAVERACSMARRSIAVCVSLLCRICIERFRCSFR